MFTLILIFNLAGKLTMTSVEKVESIEVCHSMGKQFVALVSRTPIYGYGHPHYVCLDRTMRGRE